MRCGKKQWTRFTRFAFDLSAGAMSQAIKTAAAAGTIRLGDLNVNRLGFGAMRVAGPDIWGEPKDRAAMRKLLKRAFELGHDFFDTADSYGPDVSETLIAEALHPYPKDLVIATKGGLTRPSRHRWDENGRPEHLRRAVDGSLRRLRVRPESPVRGLRRHAGRDPARRQDPAPRHLQCRRAAARHGPAHHDHCFGAERVQHRQPGI
jgi:hypothetical protein